MGKYSMSVRELLENGYDIGLKDYPIFDEDYRPILNQAIIDHYYFREIGFSNPNIWRHRLNARMRRIMRDKYNELYDKKKTEFNPLFNIDITETFNREASVDQNTTSRSTSDTTGTGHESGTDNSAGDTDVTTNNTTTGETNGNTSSDATGASNTAITEDGTTHENSRGETLATSTQFPNSSSHLWDLTTDVNIDAGNQSITTAVSDKTDKRTSDTETDTESHETGTSHSDNTSTDTGVSHTDTSQSGEYERTTNTADNNVSTMTGGTDTGELESYTRHTEGSSAGLPFSKAMLQFKDFVAAFDLDRQIIEELADLFVRVW